MTDKPKDPQGLAAREASKPTPPAKPRRGFDPATLKAVKGKPGGFAGKRMALPGKSRGR